MTIQHPHLLPQRTQRPRDRPQPASERRRQRYPPAGKAAAQKQLPDFGRADAPSLGVGRVEPILRVYVQHFYIPGLVWLRTGGAVQC
jgi:hypothetical protein